MGAYRCDCWVVGDAWPVRRQTYVRQMVNFRESTDPWPVPNYTLDLEQGRWLKARAVGSGTRDLVIATPLPCPSTEPYCCHTYNTWYDAIKIKLKHSVEQILTQGSANLGLGSWPVWANELWPASGGALFGVYLPTTRVYTLLLTFKKVARKLYSAYACLQCRRDN